MIVSETFFYIFFCFKQKNMTYITFIITIITITASNHSQWYSTLWIIAYQYRTKGGTSSATQQGANLKGAYISDKFVYINRYSKFSNVTKFGEREPC